MESASAVAAATVQRIVMDGNDVSTIINNINSLYSNALNQIIALTIGLLALGGIVLPLIIAHFQKKKSTADYELLTERISRDTQLAKEALIIEIRGDLKSEIEVFEKKLSDMKNEIKSDIKQNKALADAKTHHLQLNNLIQLQRYADAFRDCLSAIELYAAAKAERHMRIVIGVLVRVVFQHLKKIDLDNSENMQNRFDQMIEAIEKLNHNQRYAEDIMLIKNALKVALTR